MLNLAGGLQKQQNDESQFIHYIGNLIAKCLTRYATIWLESLVTAMIELSRTIECLHPCSRCSVLSTVTLRITQFRCLRSSSLELSTCSHSWLSSLPSCFYSHVKTQLFIRAY